jgi:hypothetical protein
MITIGHAEDDCRGPYLREHDCQKLFTVVENSIKHFSHIIWAFFLYVKLCHGLPTILGVGLRPTRIFLGRYKKLSIQSMTNCYHKIDRLVIAVPSSEQYLSYIQDENNFNNKYNYIEMREENMESRVWTNKIVFCSGYSDPKK